jgi:DNA primase
MKSDDKLKVYTEKEAEILFNKLRKFGLTVDKGRSTGNIYSRDRKKLAWMIKDFQNNWIIEKL